MSVARDVKLIKSESIEVDSKKTDTETELEHNCSIIQQIVTAGHEHIKDQHTFQVDKFKAIRLLHHKLVGAFNKLKRQANADPRNTYLISDAATSRINEYENQIAVLTEQMNTAETDSKEIIAKYESEKANLSKQINEIEAEKVVKVAEEQKELAIQRAQRDVEQHEFDQAQEKLDAACCSCFPCCIKKETQALEVAKLKLNKINDKIAKIEQKSAKEIAEVSIGDLRVQIAALGKKINAIIYDEQPTKIKKIIAQREENRRLGGLERAKISHKKAEYLAQITRETMIEYIYTYVCFIALKQSVDDLYEQEVDINNGKLDAEDDIFQLKTKLDALITPWNETLKKIWCPKANDKTAEQIYQDFKSLSPQDQQDFTNKKRSAELINKFVPTLIGVRLMYLNKDNNETYNPMLFTPNKIATPTNTSVAATQPPIQLLTHVSRS